MSISQNVALLVWGLTPLFFIVISSACVDSFVWQWNRKKNNIKFKLKEKTMKQLNPRLHFNVVWCLLFKIVLRLVI